jgi:hypothetical protein
VERRLRVFEKRVLKTIFRPKRDDVTGEWRKLHNEELNDLYRSPNVIRVIKSRRMRWAGHVACMEGEERCIKGFDGGPEGKRPLGRPRRRWEGYINVDLQEVELGAAWIDLAQVRYGLRALLKAGLNVQVHIMRGIS